MSIQLCDMLSLTGIIGETSDCHVNVMFIDGITIYER